MYDFKRLKEPFEEADIGWKPKMTGVKNGKPWARVLAYVDARAVFDRLDEVFGPLGWQVQYQHLQHGVMARLSVWNGSEWVSKEDGAEETQVEAFKGGISSALKRAAVPWGIGRYLYGLEATFANFVDRGTKGAKSVKIEGKYYHWLPPKLPKWALPAKKELKAGKKGGRVEASNEIEGGAQESPPCETLPSNSPRAPESLSNNTTQKLSPQKLATLKKVMDESKWGAMELAGYCRRAYDISGSRDLSEDQFRELIDLMPKMNYGKACEEKGFTAPPEKNKGQSLLDFDRMM